MWMPQVWCKDSVAQAWEAWNRGDQPVAPFELKINIKGAVMVPSHETINEILDPTLYELEDRTKAGVRQFLTRRTLLKDGV